VQTSRKSKWLYVTAKIFTLASRKETDGFNLQVAKIPPMRLSDVSALNAAIGPWAVKKSTPASPVTVVDCFKGFSASADTRDGVHFNNSGDKKVAACFAPELARIIKDNNGGGGARSKVPRPR